MSRRYGIVRDGQMPLGYFFGGDRLGVHQEWRSKKAREACRCTVKCHEGNEFATLGAFGTILGSIRSGGLRQDRFAPGWSSATRVMTLGHWDPLWTILGPIWSGVSRLGRLVLFVFACQEGNDFRIVGPPWDHLGTHLEWVSEAKGVSLSLESTTVVMSLEPRGLLGIALGPIWNGISRPGKFILLFCVPGR